MEDSRASGRAKRPAKPVDEGSWDCSVCTYKNSAEAYKCEMCDVRKGTSTRKPRINPQIVAQQVAQQFAPPLTPPPPESPEEDRLSPLTPLIEPEPEEPAALPVLPVIPVLPDPLGPPLPPPKAAPKKEKSTSQKQQKPNGPLRSNLHQKKNNSNRSARLKNIDRSTGQQMSVTVDDVTVVITDYQPKKRKLDPSKNSVQSDASDTSSNASYDLHDDRVDNNHT